MAVRTLEPMNSELCRKLAAYCGSAVGISVNESRWADFHIAKLGSAPGQRIHQRRRIPAVSHAPRHAFRIATAFNASSTLFSFLEYSYSHAIGSAPLRSFRVAAATRHYIKYPNRSIRQAKTASLHLRRKPGTPSARSAEECGPGTLLWHSIWRGRWEYHTML